MPRNSSGTYTLPSGNPVVSGTLIEASWANTTLSDLSSAMTGSLSRGGEGGMTAALRVVDGTLSVPGVAFSNETSTGLYRAGAGDFRLSVLGTAVAQFLSTGVSVTGTLGVSGAVTLSGGTANGVAYLNGSKALTSGSALTFDGTNLTATNGASIQGLTVGRGAGAVSTNTVLGTDSLGANTSGAFNTAIGLNSLFSNTTGGSNSGDGVYSLYSNTTGASNTANGRSALETNTTGNFNTGVGRDSLFSNTTASNNTAVGFQAGYANTTGTSNVAVGYQALRANTTAPNNTAVGFQSGLSNTTGQDNSAHGVYSLYANTTGSSNTAVGSSALEKNTTASNNTAVGYQAGYSNTAGINQTFLGSQAAYSATGSYNTIIGVQSGYSLTTGQGNTFVGNNYGAASCGYYVTTGTGNTILGGYTGNNGGLDIRTASNYIVLSDGDGNPRGWHGGGTWDFNCNSYMRITQNSFNYALLYYKNSDNAQWYTAATTGTAPDFRIVSGNGTGVSLGWSSTSWSAVSDERLKDIIEPITNAAAKVSTLRAVIGKYKTDADGTRRSFLIAQDVQAVLPEAVSKTTQSVEDSTEYLGIQYTEVIPLLVAAIKELKAEIDILKGQP